MVAFLIHDTKKMVVGIILSYTLTAFTNFHGRDTQLREIEKCIELDATICQESAKIGEKVELKVIFKNKTDATVYFYPKALLLLVKTTDAFGFESFLINDKLDITKVIKIKPKEIYCDKYQIVLKQPFFHEGLNTFKLWYRCKQMTGSLEKYNKMYGELESDELKLMMNQSIQKSH